jgi:hypothetical protein
VSTILRKLACEPNGSLAGEAYIASRNFIVTGLMTEGTIRDRLLAKTTLAPADANSAIERGFAAARKPKAEAYEN